MDKRFKRKEARNNLDGKGVAIWSRKNRAEALQCNIASGRATAKFAAGYTLTFNLVLLNSNTV